MRTWVKNIIRNLSCCVGRHKWKFEIYYGRYGVAVGDKCSVCGLWSERNSIRSEWPKEKDCEGF